VISLAIIEISFPSPTKYNKFYSIVSFLRFGLFGEKVKENIYLSSLKRWIGFPKSSWGCIGFFKIS